MAAARECLACRLGFSEMAYRQACLERRVNMKPDLQRLLGEAQYVRHLARHLLADESDDVEQQTWLCAIQHGTAGVKQPRAWLGRIVRNVTNSLHRTNRRERRHEPLTGAEAAVPSSAELLVQEEQRRTLVTLVDGLPRDARAVILLRYFEGLPPQAIARQLSLPTTTVWNRLRRGLQLLRERLDATHDGKREAWLLALAPRAPSGAGTALSTTTLATHTTARGGRLVAMMTRGNKVAALGVLVAFAGFAAFAATRDRAPQPPVVSADRPQVVADIADLQRGPKTMESGFALPRQLVSVPSEPPSEGSLVVRVVGGKNKAPAQSVIVIVRKHGTYAPAHSWRVRTDATGKAEFASITAGRMVVSCDRDSTHHRVDIVSGKVTEFEYKLPVGLLVTGVVVDATGRPVAGALIEVGPLATIGVDAEVLATSGLDGRFSIKAAPHAALVGARADGHAASSLKFVWDRSGDEVEVRLQLGEGAGNVDGLVVDARGRPVPNALVRIGHGNTQVLSMKSPPLPALVRSDVNGRFRAVGVPPGKQPVVARADGFSPWRGTCEVFADRSVPLRLNLRPGGVIRGLVCDADGEPVADARIEVGQRKDFTYDRVLSTRDGRFELRGLFIGQVRITARHRDQGAAELLINTDARTASKCELRLALGRVLVGKVVDEAGNAISGALLECLAQNVAKPWSAVTRSDSTGKFRMVNCPALGDLRMVVKAHEFDVLRHDDIKTDLPLKFVMVRAKK